MTEVEVRLRVPKNLIESAKRFNVACYGPSVRKNGVIRIFGPHVSESDAIDVWFFDVLRFAQKYAVGKIRAKPWEVELPIDEDRSIGIYSGLINFVMHKLTGEWNW